MRRLGRYPLFHRRALSSLPPSKSKIASAPPPTPSLAPPDASAPSAGPELPGPGAVTEAVRARIALTRMHRPCRRHVRVGLQSHFSSPVPSSWISGPGRPLESFRVMHTAVPVGVGGEGGGGQGTGIGSGRADWGVVCGVELGVRRPFGPARPGPARLGPARSAPQPGPACPCEEGRSRLGKGRGVGLGRVSVGRRRGGAGGPGRPASGGRRRRSRDRVT